MINDAERYMLRLASDGCALGRRRFEFAMPQAVAKHLPPSAPRRTTSHLFGAVGPQAVVIAREENSQRERAQAEARRISGNFYVDRMIGSVRPR